MGIGTLRRHYAVEVEASVSVEATDRGGPHEAVFDVVLDVTGVEITATDGAEQGATEAPVFGPQPEPETDAPADGVTEMVAPEVEVVVEDDTEAPASDVDRPERPALSGKGSGIEAWVTYALAQGKTDAEVDGLSRDQIAALFE